MGDAMVDMHSPAGEMEYTSMNLPTATDTARTPYVVSQDHIHRKRPVRVICIGAGIAGIAAAYKFQRRLTDASFAIYEKNHDVGGTWLENRYPGCACDIPAHGYTYSWEGNPEWSRLCVSLFLPTFGGSTINHISSSYSLMGFTATSRHPRFISTSSPAPSSGTA